MIIDLREELEALRTENALQLLEIEDLLNQVEGLEDMVDDLQNKILDLEEEIESLKWTIESLEEDSLDPYADRGISLYD